jgi:hypothetical protein
LTGGLAIGAVRDHRRRLRPPPELLRLRWPRELADRSALPLE